MKSIEIVAVPAELVGDEGVVVWSTDDRVVVEVRQFGRLDEGAEIITVDVENLDEIIAGLTAARVQAEALGMLEAKAP